MADKRIYELSDATLDDNHYLPGDKSSFTEALRFTVGALKTFLGFASDKLGLANGGTGAATAAAARANINKGASALTYSTTIAVDCSANNFFTLTLTASTATISAPTNLAAGATGMLEIAASTFTVAWAAGWDWGAAGTPTLTASKTAAFTFWSPDGTKARIAVLQGFS